jgi:hypothetical protein
MAAVLLSLTSIYCMTFWEVCRQGMLQLMTGCQWLLGQM